jgi:UDP-N-acetyl-2-amino-2-deoxyglucuronate dehydrogenase
MVHVGLIGAGNISDTHARAARAIPGVRIAAVHAPTRDHAERLARAHGAAAYDTLDAFLDHRPMEMVAIGSPSGLHGDHGVAAARRGLHVLVEKPLEITTGRADAFIAEAARAGVVLGVIFQDRLKPDIVRLKALVDAGHLGRPILGTARVKWHRTAAYYRDSRWRGTKALDGGGALINQAIHTVDLLLWCFGPVSRVFGKTATSLHAIEAEDTAVAVLEFINGALATIEATTAAFPGYARRLELTGSEGTAMLDGDRLVSVDLRGGGPITHVDGAPAAGAVSAASPVVADASAHQRVFEDFIRALSGNTAPACDGVSGRSSVAVIEAIYRSAASGHPTEIARLTPGSDPWV